MFFTALIFNILSSYLIASIFGNFLIIFIAFFALIVLNMEILSLFGAINEINALIFAFLNLVLAIFAFKFKKANFLKINFDFKRLKNALLLDKSLIVLSIAFCFMLLITLFLALVMPVLEPDSQTYHFLRAYEFFRQGSLAHFEINDIRALVMPINSEIIYSWLLLFKKNFYGYGIVSFGAFILTICSLWSIFEKFKYAFRKRLYAIFLFSSLCAITIQMTSLQTDLLVGSLLLCAFALFIRNSIYFSSLSLALAMGVKSTGVVAVLAFFILIIFYEKLIEKNKKISKIKEFSLYLFLNFLIFSSYNYFLNLIHFHNPFANRTAYIGHKFWGGFKGYIANLIHFTFQSLDFTGFKWGYYLNDEILNIKKAFMKLINISPALGSNIPQEKINILTDEQTIGFGILGFLVFLPTIIVSFFKFFFNKNKRTILSFLFAIIFIINILVLARTVAYMVYSIRFVVAFVVLSSVILINVYRKKSFIKPVILFFCLFYMLLIPSHNRRMPLWVILKSLSEVNYDLAKFEDKCYNRKVIDTLEVAPRIYETIKTKYNDKKNIAFLKPLTTSALYLKKLEYEGINIDFINIGEFNDEKMQKYDLIILEEKVQNDNVFNPEDIIKKYKVEGDRVIFDSDENYNCYYSYLPYEKKEEYNATERTCFSYMYISRAKNFKLDFHDKFKEQTDKRDIELFYFIKK